MMDHISHIHVDTNMKTFVILALFGAALAAPQGDPDAQILRQESDIQPDGSYQYAFETSNGIAAQEQGQLKSVGEEQAINVQGQFQYSAPDGSPIQVSYIADENGFQPQGAHLPTPPPIPAAIQKSLAYLATAPPQPEQQ